MNEDSTALRLHAELASRRVYGCKRYCASASAITTVIFEFWQDILTAAIMASSAEPQRKIAYSDDVR